MATLPSLAPKCSTALNTREVIFSTTLEITWCNSIAYRYPTANGDHLFIEMVGSLQESKIPYMVIDLRKCIDLTHTTASYLSFNATLFGHLITENISITEIPHLSLDMNTFYF